MDLASVDYLLKETWVLDNSKTVLNVEDNDDNRLLIRRLLQFSGFQVVEAKNGFEALESLQTLQPDLILVDINMPDMDGYSLTSQIKTLPTCSILRSSRSLPMPCGVTVKRLSRRVVMATSKNPSILMLSWIRSTIS